MTKRIAKTQNLPAKPIGPTATVKRVGFLRHSVELTLVEDQDFKDFTTLYYTNSVFNNDPYWYVYGANRAHRFAKRKLSKYMRQISYRSGAGTLYTGKEV